MSEREPIPVKGDDEDTDPDRKPGPMRDNDPILQIKRPAEYRPLVSMTGSRP